MTKLAFTLCLLIVGCSNSSSVSQQQDDEDERIQSCVARGVAYYKEIGSYPRLQSEDISAEDKSLQFCVNTPDTAFM